MKLLNPAGLWLLLGIPVLIIIYLIKAQHEDQAVSSTFIWKLSSRFMKKRQPMQKFRKILLLILQLLIVLTVAILAARPAVISGDCCDYIAIIDASASMQTVDEEGQSRFRKAVEQVDELAEKIYDGHSLSVILASDTAARIAERSTSVNEVRLALKVAEGKNGGCDTALALEDALQICQTSKNPKILFYTDRPFPGSENVEVIEVGGGEWNLYVDGLSIKLGAEESVFSTTVFSNRVASVTVGLRVDGKTVDAKKVDCAAQGGTAVEFKVTDISAYDTAEVFAQAEDDLQLDNSYAVCREKKRTYRIGLASDSPLYLQSVLEAQGNCTVTCVSAEEADSLSEQQLYIYDGVVPTEIPSGGSVLIFNASELPDGLRADDKVTVPAQLQLEAALAEELNISFTDTVITEYTPLRGSAAWSPLLNCGEDAVAMLRSRGSGRFTCVMGFDLHNSNLPLQTEFVVLMQELIRYLVPDFLKKTDHLTEQPVTLTVMSDAKEIYIQRPDGSVLNPTVYKDVCRQSFSQPGVYTAVMTNFFYESQYVDFSVHIPYEERTDQPGEALTVTLPEQESVPLESAYTEIWFWLSLGILLIVLLEWGWYYREQY